MRLSVSSNPNKAIRPIINPGIFSTECNFFPDEICKKSGECRPFVFVRLFFSLCFFSLCFSPEKKRERRPLLIPRPRCCPRHRRKHRMRKLKKVAFSHFFDILKNTMRCMVFFFGIRRLPIFPGRHQPSIFGV